MAPVSAGSLLLHRRISSAGGSRVLATNNCSGVEHRLRPDCFAGGGRGRCACTLYISTVDSFAIVSDELDVRTRTVRAASDSTLSKFGSSREELLLSSAVLLCLADEHCLEYFTGTVCRFDSVPGVRGLNHRSSRPYNRRSNVAGVSGNFESWPTIRTISDFPLK